MSVEVIGLKELLSGFESMGGTVSKEGRQFMQDLGDWTARQVQAHIEDQNAIDLGELHDNIHAVTETVAGGIQTTVRPSDKADKYAIFVEEGTRPHWPPIDAIQGWADRHGIPAFLVARKISIDGTDPRHMFASAYRDLDRETDGRLSGFAVQLVKEI